MIDAQIPATYGYFFLQSVFFNPQEILRNMKNYEKSLGWGGANDLERICQESADFVASWELSESIHMTQQDLTRILIDAGQDVLTKNGCAVAHLFLFTKPLLNLNGGRLVDPTGNDGLHRDLKSAKKFHKVLDELRNWEKHGLWESVWAPFGGEDSVNILEIPREKVPFSIEEIRWSWGYMNDDSDLANGYLIDICDLAIHPNETLVHLKKRFDQALNPIKIPVDRILMINYWFNKIL